MTRKKFFTRFTALALAALSLSAFAPAAEARDRDHDRWDRREHWRHDRGRHHGWERARYVQPRPVVVYSYPGYYYRPQPVYYVPAQPYNSFSYSISW